MVVGQLDEDKLDEAKTLASRVLHYGMRLKRIDQDGCTPDQVTTCTDTERKSDLVRVILTGILANNVTAPSPNVTTGTNTTGSSGTNITGASSSGGGQTVHQNDEPNRQGRQNGPQTDSIPPGGPTLNSTVIGSDPFNANANISGASNVETPYNAANEMQRRREAETARRLAEFQVCKGRIEELHEDVYNEYCRPSSPRRPIEAQAQYDRLVALEAVLRGILSLTTDPVLKEEIEQQISLLLVDSYVLQANIMVAARQLGGRATNTPTPVGRLPQTAGQAHSTIRPQAHQPSVQYFNRELDAMTFNVSQPFTIHDSQMARGVDAVLNDARNVMNPPHVTFGANPVTFIPNGTYQQNTATAANGAPTPNTHTQPLQQPNVQIESTPRASTAPPTSAWRPTNEPIQTNQPYESTPWNPTQSNGIPSAQTQAGSHNNSSGGLPNRQAGRTYHPAVSPHRYPDYAVEARDHSNSQYLVDAQIGQLPSMNACQGQQYLARVLGHRRYEGNVTDHAKSFSLEEFMGHARSYQRSTGTTDAVVLTQLATFFANRAFKWWQTNSTLIFTLDELETRLKSRFEGKANDGLATLSAFCTRRQEKGERLLDYIDDMRQLAMDCYPPLPAPQVITCIIDNSIEKNRNLLAARQYESVASLTMFAEYLARAETEGKSGGDHFTPKKSNYPYHQQQKSIYAVEAGTDSVNNETEPIEEKSEAENSATAVIDMLAREFNKWNSNRKPQTGQRVAQAQMQTTPNTQSNTPIRNTRPGSCWVCQTPGVYQHECEKCNPAKNVQANQ